MLIVSLVALVELPTIQQQRCLKQVKRSSGGEMWEKKHTEMKTVKINNNNNITIKIWFNDAGCNTPKGFYFAILSAPAKL